MNKAKELKKLKLNSYGSEFFTIDSLGNMFIYSFEYCKAAKFPKITLWNTNSKSCKDACFINNSWLIATTFDKSNMHTTLYDFLLPINQVI